MVEKQESSQSVADGHSEIEQADKLYSLVMTMGAEWGSVNDVKAQLIEEYAKDAIELFGKTNHEKRVELKRLIEKCEDITPPESFESLKKRAERAFLRIAYPRNQALRNTLFAAILSVTLLSLVVPVLIKRGGQKGQNSTYSVLVFHKPEQQTTASALADALLSAGFKSSATSTHLTEAMKQFKPNEAWVIFTSRGKEKLPEVKRILMAVAPNVHYIDEPQPSNLQRGDIQILLF